MNTYLVRINIQTGEYQKIVTTLVDAKTQQEAGKLALENECHADIGEPDSAGTFWHEGGIVDLSWEFYYTLKNIKQIQPEYVEVFREYL